MRELKVMLVEDNPDDVALTKLVLRRSGLDRDLVLAADGREAVDKMEGLLAEGAKLPDLILLDINLPVVGGLELLTRLKQDPRFGRISVVMLTGSNVGDDIQRSYDLGASTYLVKPISKDALITVIENLFSG